MTINVLELNELEAIFAIKATLGGAIKHGIGTKMDEEEVFKDKESI
ncbi:6903_t:CDS:2 [Scutellospora calospora]|uniref:6903_t:CDS:1 n=1 Tax=Scutellospora calospora TaxID=85575 RepID=A0ACA9KTU6_9GLOM|nr:6903_t:CDS:2 [Scutellospora calospora]